MIWLDTGYSAKLLLAGYFGRPDSDIRPDNHILSKEKCYLQSSALVKRVIKYVIQIMIFELEGITHLSVSVYSY